MRWLLTQDPANPENEIYLPCPADALIQFVIAVGGVQTSTELNRILRLNPALLLVALRGFHGAHLSPPECGSQLIEWSQECLVDFVLKCLSRHQSRDASRMRIRKPKKLKSFFSQHLRARSNKRLRASLRQFLATYCEVESTNAKRLVSKIVGKNLRADELDCKRIRKRRTIRLAVQPWVNPSPQYDVETLLKLASCKMESDLQFEARLTEEKLASMKQLAYGASHEINNPLANVATRAQTMLAVEHEPEKRHKLAVIYEQAMRAHEMISDMMLFAHPPALTRGCVSIRIMLSRLIYEMTPYFESSAEISTTFTIAAGVDQVDLDETQCSVAIKSLIQNAFESLTSPPNSTSNSQHRVDVRAGRSRSGDLEVVVSDTGKPLDSSVARHLFDPFYSGREAGRGLGFGLSKAWTIARLHHGSLKYEANSNGSPKFVLTIPGAHAEPNPDSKAVLSIRKNQSNIEDAA